MTETPITHPTTGQPAGAAGAAGGSNAHIDIQQLADKVYALMLADARLAHKRGDSPVPAQRRSEG